MFAIRDIYVPYPGTFSIDLDLVDIVQTIYAQLYSEQLKISSKIPFG